MLNNFNKIYQNIINEYVMIPIPEKFQLFKDLLLQVCKEDEKENLSKEFDKYFKYHGSILFIDPKSGELKLVKSTKILFPENFNYLKKHKDEAKTAREKLA